jgi:DNA-binding MarR family transcriptional regulator
MRAKRTWILPVVWMVRVDRMVRFSMIVHMTRTMVERSPAPADPATVAKAGIIADFRATMGELKCVGSERLVRLGISMTQLHVMHLLERHGEMAMSRLADMLGVSVSNATGLIDRVEERGYVERIRVPSDRRVVLVRITAAGLQVLDEVEAIRDEVLQRVLDRMDPDQIDSMATAMADLREAVTAAVADPASGAHHAHEPQGRD